MLGLINMAQTKFIACISYPQKVDTPEKKITMRTEELKCYEDRFRRRQKCIDLFGELFKKQ